MSNSMTTWDEKKFVSTVQHPNGGIVSEFDTIWPDFDGENAAGTTAHVTIKFKQVDITISQTTGCQA